VVVLAGFWGGERTEGQDLSRCGWVERQPGPRALWKTELLVGATGGPASANRSNGCQEKIEIASTRTESPAPAFPARRKRCESVILLLKSVKTKVSVSAWSGRRAEEVQRFVPSVRCHLRAVPDRAGCAPLIAQAVAGRATLIE
jgi:hypothetical protein